MDFEKAQSLKEMATKEGINTTYKDKKIYEWVLDIIGKIKEDRKFINPLRKLLEKQMTPRDIYENLYKKDPQKAIFYNNPLSQGHKVRWQNGRFCLWT